MLETPPDRRARLAAIVQRRVMPVLTPTMSAPAAAAYLNVVTDALLVEDPTVSNLMHAPLTQIILLLRHRTALHPNQPLDPRFLLAHHRVFQALVDNVIWNDFNHQPLAMQLLHPKHDRSMPLLALMLTPQLLLHVKTMVKLDLSFQQAAEHIVNIPPTMLLELLGERVRV